MEGGWRVGGMVRIRGTGWRVGGGWVEDFMMRVRGTGGGWVVW